MLRFRRKALIVALSIGLSCLASFLILTSYPWPSCSSSHCPQAIGPATYQHHLAVLVPFRSRFDELLLFTPHMTSFLHRQGINFSLHILNQVDELRFNRASLINAGFKLIGHKSDYIAIHDVDLLPLNDQLSYHFPGHGTPFHVSSPELHPKYHYPNFVGGILLITSRDFENVNGLSNKYWGWGLEDDEFFVRMKEKNLKITRPEGIITGIDNTFAHHHKRSQKRDTAKLFNQKEVTRRRDRETGLHDVNYRLVSSQEVTISGSSCTVHSIELICDQSISPWCKADPLRPVNEI